MPHPLDDDRPRHGCDIDITSGNCGPGERRNVPDPDGRDQVSAGHQSHVGYAVGSVKRAYYGLVGTGPKQQPIGSASQGVGPMFASQRERRKDVRRATQRRQ